MSTQQYTTPQTAAEAYELLEEAGHDGKIVAGGQSLSLLIRQGLLDPTILIDITDVDEFNAITVEDGRVRIGATASYTDLEEHELGDEIGVLRDSLAVIADPQVKNMGTIGGAISHADPSLDIIPPLLCLDADVVIGSTSGTRTVPLEAFAFGYMTTDLGEDELVAAVEFDRPDGASAYQKHANVKGGWATVGSAAYVTLSADGHLETARVALTAMADTAIRTPTAESALRGIEPTADAIEDAAQSVVEDTDPLADISGSVEYKQRLAQALTARAVTTAVKRQ